MIRLAKLEDAPTLTLLAQNTFREKWLPIDGEMLVEQYITENMQSQHIQKALSSSNVKFFIAFYEEEAVGYMKLVEEFIPSEFAYLGNSFLQIEKLYLMSTAQRRQLGSKLLQKAFEIADEKNYDTIWLGVWSKNYQAIQFYEKFGFEKAGDWFFKMGDKICEDEWLMVKKQIARANKSNSSMK
ncbi:MAG: spermidine/spermine N(1)-acetyltransferase [Raineya sp.]